MESELTLWGGPGLRRFDDTEHALLKEAGLAAEDLSTARMAARRLRLDEATLLSLCRNFGVPRFNVNGHVRFHVTLVMIWLFYHPTLWASFMLTGTPDISGRR